jgi:hypothetical protein
MSTLRKRLEKLEKSIPPIVDPDVAWGELAAFRDDYLRDQAQERGEAYAADLKKQLMDDGPLAFRIAVIRGFLKIHGIEEGPNESLASTMARAAGVETSEVLTCLQEGRFAQAVIDNVEKAKQATDNGS